ncbi:MAG TPA: hypothetical protein VF546_13230 [Pyrinomonadaceae bacterium]|jgi:hypothetical protein
MTQLLRALARSLVKLPLELLRLLLLLLLLLLWLIWTLLLFLLWRRWRGDYKPCDRRPCADEIPPHVRRKPDPCLYDQFYLMQQNIPVTWYNPDIFLTELDGTPVDSSQLQGDHTYVVHGRIWDASFEPALAVEVRCYFQDWGFNGPRAPVEFNADGTERVVLLNIAPWGNAVAQFRWTTPGGPGHYCLKVGCYHPDDKNPANNVGQENTDVRGGVPGETLLFPARLMNPFQRPLRVRFTADTYQIPAREWEFPLVTRTRTVGAAAERTRGAQRGEKRGTTFRQWLWGWGNGPTSVVYNYVGREELLQAQREVPAGIPPGWGVTVDGQPLDQAVTLAAGESRDVELALQIPATAQPGEELAFNFNAVAPERGPLGGVTVRIRVR